MELDPILRSRFGFMKLLRTITNSIFSGVRKDKDFLFKLLLYLTRHKSWQQTGQKHQQEQFSPSNYLFNPFHFLKTLWNTPMLPWNQDGNLSFLSVNKIGNFFENRRSDILSIIRCKYFFVPNRFYEAIQMITQHFHYESNATCHGFGFFPVAEEYKRPA